MNVYLIGFMGCGKTTIGKKIANKLNYRFLDLDEYIENKTGRSISTIFELTGETGFRIIEQNALREVAAFKETVISTGGGTPCFLNNIDLINKSGLSFYLKYKPEVLASRLTDAKENRPLLKNKTDEELLNYVKHAVLQRENFYSKAHHTIESMNIKVDDFMNVPEFRQLAERN